MEEDSKYNEWKDLNKDFLIRFLKEYLKDNLRIETTMYNDNHVYVTTYLEDEVIQEDKFVY